MTKLNFPIGVAQMSSKPGDVHGTLEKMFRTIRTARMRGARIVVFDELAPSAYMLGDRWENDAFIREIEAGNEKLREASEGLVVIWGSVKADWDKIGEDGRLRKYNAAFIAQNGAWVSNETFDGWLPKANLPKYRIFDDERHFYPAPKLAAEMGFQLEELLRPFEVTIDGKSVRLALATCEDLWQDEYKTKTSRFYREQTDLLIDLSHSPWTAQKWRARDRMLHKRAIEVGCPILYVNAVGLQNNDKNLVWFDGDSSLVDPSGTVVWSAPIHSEVLSIINPVQAMAHPQTIRHLDGIAEKHAAIIPAMRAFYAPFKRVVVGLSGGVDSAVSLALLVEALGSDRVLAINMPTQFNSATTRDLAAQCASNFGVEYRVVPIQDQYEARVRLLECAGYVNLSSFDRGNVQARIRGQVLADISAAEASRLGGRCAFTNNGNKTEVALNYFTEYGDGAGTACFLGDLWKGEVYELATFVNECAGKELIPWRIIRDLVPSAEL
ncbi:NAD(+) synthase, partial [Candidatus Kaiserbacteria bacterium]|nr:NAD(+) synthase [Candidatus Kaiserbacteria bacterium]